MMDANTDPIEQVNLWLEDAAQHPAITEPTAMTLATADAHGFPSARTILLKGFDAKGAVFYTNSNSQKGQELIINPQACLLFYWMPLQRQLRISGDVEKVSDPESDAYFQGRRRGSQIGAHASHQSEPLENYETLKARVREKEKEFEGDVIPRPAHWFGWRVSLNRIEFWQEGEYRLHQRYLYQHKGSGWEFTMLNP